MDTPIAEEFRKSHGGWCYTENGSVLCAIARGPIANTITELIKINKDHIARTIQREDDVEEYLEYLSHFHHVASAAHISGSQSRHFGYSDQTSRTVPLNSRIPMYTDLTCYVTCTGASKHAKRTLCRVDGYLVKLSLYYVVETKLISRIVADISDHLQARQYFKSMIATPDTYDFKPHEYSVAKLFNASDTALVSTITNTESFVEAYWTALNEKLPSDGTLLHDRCKKFAVNLAAAMSACAVQHNASIDGGMVFRDGRGRTSTLEAYDASINVLLYQ